MENGSNDSASHEPRLETRVATFKLSSLRLLSKEENARFMTQAEFKQLVENLRIDGRLTSTPLVYRGEVLSGNHRVEAALAAGIEEAECLEIVTELSPPRRIALQLSHNAIVGKDDMGVLQAAYRSLDLSWKRFSGLTEESFAGLKPVDISALAISAPKYQELILLFLPEELDRFNEAFARFKKKLDGGKAEAHVAHLDDFERIFEAVVRVKKVRGIHNSALAFRAMAEIALAALEGQEEQK